MITTIRLETDKTGAKRRKKEGERTIRSPCQHDDIVNLTNTIWPVSLSYAGEFLLLRIVFGENLYFRLQI